MARKSENSNGYMVWINSSPGGYGSIVIIISINFDSQKMLCIRYFNKKGKRLSCPNRYWTWQFQISQPTLVCLTFWATLSYSMKIANLFFHKKHVFSEYTSIFDIAEIYLSSSGTYCTNFPQMGARVKYSTHVLIDTICWEKCVSIRGNFPLK